MTTTSSADSLDRVLNELFRQSAGADRRSFESIDEWWPTFREARSAWALPIDQALVGGVLADRVGYAFAAGYQGALRRMDPRLPLDRMASFSVTEEGGGHPRAVQSTLTPAGNSFLLSGKKKWATLSSGGGVALVVASTGSDDAGRNRLKVARVDLSAPGVTVVQMPATPFSPEIPHCRLELEAVALSSDAVLGGDGYELFVKPFRTIEDIHVSAAILAYVFGVARRCSWPHAVIEELIALLVALRGLGLAEPSAPSIHIALEGVFNARHELLSRCSGLWDSVPEEERSRWQRDSALSNVAGGARMKRAEVAWERVER